MTNLTLFNFSVKLYIDIFLAFSVVVFLRIAFLVFKNVTGRSRTATTQRKTTCKTVICIGSGGHTTEMLGLIYGINFNNYTPRYYVMASSDKTSYTQVKNLELTFSRSTKYVTKHYVVKIPRSRVVHQSYITSVFTTLYSILYSIPFIVKTRPDLVLCNGPGTCIPICGLAFLLKVFFIKDVRIVFIESFCRTKTLSLTGKILMYFADNFIVQWPELVKKCKRTEYIGQLL